MVLFMNCLLHISQLMAFSQQIMTTCLNGLYSKIIHCQLQKFRISVRINIVCIDSQIMPEKPSTIFTEKPISQHRCVSDMNTMLVIWQKCVNI